MSTQELTAVRGTTEAGVVEVRVRHTLSATGATLGWFPLDGIQRVIDTLLRWGLYDEDGGTLSHTAGAVSGSFRLDGPDVFFDIVIEPEQE